MKTMTCKQLSGACDKKISANTFEEMGKLCKEHAMQMFKEKDQDHIQAMQKMKELMKDPKAVQECFKKMRNEFDNLPEDK
jgi:hypothetical protein